MHLLLVGLLLLGPACQEKTGNPDQDPEPIYTAESQWVRVSPPDVGARFAMPAEPEYLVTQFDKVVKNHVMTVHQYSKTINNGTANFVFVYHDLHVPMDTSRTRRNTLDGAVKGAQARLFGKMLSNKNIKHLNKYPGREFVFVVDTGDTILKFSARIFLVGQRLYQLNLVMTDEAFDQKMANKFFDSFGLVKMDADLPPKPTKIPIR